MAYTTVDKSSLHFTPKLWTGNNGASLTISGLNFQPDLTWIKARNATETHGLYDIIRGALYRLQSSSSNASTSTTGTVTGWTSDGFSLGTSDEVNGTYNYASWNWKANGTGSANNAGSINATVSANTTSGFSIVQYTGNGSSGATVAHGLGVTPKVIIVKRQPATDQMIMYHPDLNATPQNYYIRVSDAGVSSDFAGMWNDTAPTSSLFSIGNSATTNANSEAMIAYCFAEKQGFSKFGKYVGNGNSDGSFVYLGFKPAWILIKDIGRAEAWYMFDNKRLGYNGATADFIANTNVVESNSSATLLDFLSNGFKLTGTTDHLNGSGQNFIYMAFAEAPLVGSNNVPATAR